MWWSCLSIYPYLLFVFFLNQYVSIFTVKKKKNFPKGKREFGNYMGWVCSGPFQRMWILIGLVMGLLKKPK